MRPPKRLDATDYERIKLYDDWILGQISEIQLREDHDTGFKNEKTGAPIICDQVRLKFALEGHDYPHYSRWMRYSYGEKANLYLKYLKYIVENAQPDMKFDLDSLKGLKVKTMWGKSEDGKYDNLESIRAIARVPRTAEPVAEEAAEEVAAHEDSDIPF